MSNFSIPPTQVPIADEDALGHFLTESQWLRWFIDVANTISSILNVISGGGLGVVVPANQIYAGPTSGAAALPTFRALTDSDLPGSLFAFAAAHG